MKKPATVFSLFFVLAMGSVWFSSGAWAEIKTKSVIYEDNGVTLKGMLAWDDAKSGRRPGILVIHEWWGLNDYAKDRARKLAGEGYVAFALDMYGSDKVTDHPKQAGEWMKQITGNIDLWTRRAKLGLAVLKDHPDVAGNKTAAIGYCFGGATVMQMAYAGQDVKAVASFHGSLPAASANVTAVSPRIFVAHGRDDKFVPAERIAAFTSGLDRVKADWEMTVYSGTRHSFTNPAADTRGIDNLAYNKKADMRSWAAMLSMFDEVFQ